MTTASNCIGTGRKPNGRARRTAHWPCSRAGSMSTISWRNAWPKYDEIRLNYRGDESVLPLPPHSGLPELGIVNCRSRINPTSMGGGWGEGLRSLIKARGPSPDLLRKSTSPRRGEVEPCLLQERLNQKSSRSSFFASGFRHGRDGRHLLQSRPAPCQ